MSGAASPPALSAGTLQARVEEILARDPSVRFIGFHLPGMWEAPPAQLEPVRVAGREVPVAFCPSALAFRSQLVEREGAGAPAVLLTDRSAEELGADVLARLHRRKLLSLSSWEALRERLGVQIDPRLFPLRWFPDYFLGLLAAGAVKGFGDSGPSSAALDAEDVWRTFLERLGFTTPQPDLPDLLEWTAEAEKVARFAELPEGAREAHARPLAESAVLEAAAEAVLRMVGAGRGAEAVAAGLVLESLYPAVPHGVAAARAWAEAVVDAFDRLHPALQHHIVNSFGWTGLRPLQANAVEPVLAGGHALLVAPTAGGKTEAAVLPLLSRMLAEDWRGLSVLYVCPLRALLNNLESRLSGYLRLLGRQAAVWHGDVGAGARREIQREPPDLLLTTPESIEVMLTSRRIDHGALFRDLRAVVIDELHAFAGDDRGWHLLAVLERVSRVAGRDLQRVRLSATIGNPEALLGWLAGSSPGPRTVVSPEMGWARPAAGTAAVPVPDVRIDHVGSLDNAAHVISRLHRGEKRLFCDSRSRVEELAFQLRNRGVETYVSHGSLGVDERRQAERAFAEARDCVIAATSTLELGIDVGDLDRVIQIDAPATVSSFLQRLGRTGRRTGTSRNLLFLATNGDALLRAAAIGQLWTEGYVEPVEPPALPYTIYAQQVLALAHQLLGMPRGTWSGWLDGMPGFAALPPEGRAAVAAYLESEGYLFADSGVLGPGPESDKRFRGKGFLELLSVFETSPVIRVLYGRKELGSVDEATFQLEREGIPILLLGGRSWRLVHMDWSRREAYVEPIDLPGRSLWLGGGVPLSYALCQAQKRILLGESPDELLTRRGRQALDELRGRYPRLTEGATTLERTVPGRTRWWTFAGLKANAALADHLKSSGCPVQSRDNFALTFEGSLVPEALLPHLPKPAEAGNLPPVSLAEDALESLKFSFCTPEELCRAELGRRLSDPAGVERVVGAGVVWVGADPA